MKSSSPTTDGAAQKPTSPNIPEHVLVGIVRRAHGLRGEVIVGVETDRADERFAAGAAVDLVDANGRRRQLRVRRSVAAPGGLRVSFESVEDRDAAEALRGGRLEVEGAEVPPADAGTFYHFDLIGCRSVDEREGELGEVTDLVESPGGLLLEVSRPGGGKLLLPFVERFLVRVEPERRRIEWRLPEGLVEACVSRS